MLSLIERGVKLKKPQRQRQPKTVQSDKRRKTGQRRREQVFRATQNTLKNEISKRQFLSRKEGS